MCLNSSGLDRDERKQEAICRARRKLLEWTLRNSGEDFSNMAHWRIQPAWPVIQGSREERLIAMRVMLKRKILLAERGMRVNEMLCRKGGVKMHQYTRKAYADALRMLEAVLAHDSEAHGCPKVGKRDSSLGVEVVASFDAPSPEFVKVCLNYFTAEALAPELLHRAIDQLFVPGIRIREFAAVCHEL
jgi:hypothetical protein